LTVRGTTWVFVFGLAALAAQSAVSSPRALALGDGDAETQKETRPVIDETQVYYGKAVTCRKPAVVDADKVFQAIPEYKKILEGKLTEKDPKYSILMRKASRKFKAAIEGAATEGKYDLVANIGAVTWEGHDVPDITDDAIARVEEE